MDKMRVLVLLFSLSLGIAIIVWILSPTPSTRNNSVKISAVVTQINENRMGDITMSLQDKRGIYYFPKENVKEIAPRTLESTLIKQKVTLYYAKPHFLSKLSPQTDTKRVTELSFQGKVYFSDFKN